MVDTVDNATEHADFLLNLALLRRKKAHDPVGSGWCEDCGWDIPAARRLAVPGCVTCIACQEVRERRR